LIEGAIPLVSVVIPTKDRRDLLREALASVRALAGDDLRIEIIVADNGSSDDSSIVAAEFGARFVTNDKPGASATRNAGFRVATGDYIVFLDDDDVFLPEHLRPHLAMLHARPDFGAVVGQVQLADMQLTPFMEPYPSSMPDDGDLYRAFFGENPQVGATVSRMSVRESVGYFNEDLLSSEDAEWSLRLALRHPVGFVPVPSILFRQRPMATHDDLQWMRLRVDAGVMIASYRAAGRRRPPLAFAARAISKFRGQFYWYFVQSALVHADKHERAQMRQSIFRAFCASPIHASHDLLRPSDLRRALRLAVSR